MLATSHVVGGSLLATSYVVGGSLLATSHVVGGSLLATPHVVGGSLLATSKNRCDKPPHLAHGPPVPPDRNPNATPAGALATNRRGSVGHWIDIRVQGVTRRPADKLLRDRSDSRGEPSRVAGHSLALRAESNRRLSSFPLVRNAGFEPALCASQSHALPTELISLAVFVGVCSVHTLQWIASVRQPGVQRTRSAKRLLAKDLGMTVVPSKLVTRGGIAPPASAL